MVILVCPSYFCISVHVLYIHMMIFKKADDRPCKIVIRFVMFCISNWYLMLLNADAWIYCADAINFILVCLMHVICVVCFLNNYKQWSVQGAFVRQNTPFPRDLRTHRKPPPKSIDGAIIHHNPNKEVCLKSAYLLNNVLRRMPFCLPRCL